MSFFSFFHKWWDDDFMSDLKNYENIQIADFYKKKKKKSGYMHT